MFKYLHLVRLFDQSYLCPLSVMAYDLQGLWDDPRITGSHSDIAQINEAIDFMITNSSVPPSQIVMGLATYGRSYTLENKTCTTLGCPFREDSNETAIGGCLDTTGFVPYVEIYDWTEEGKGKGFNSITVDAATASAYMVKNRNQFISYDNPQSFQMKVDYASKKCLGGTMVWAIDMIPTDVKSSGSTGSAGGAGGSGAAGESSNGEALEEGMLDAYCGMTWDDSLSCKVPCPSGSSDDCGEGEMCFAGVPCGEGGAGRPLRDSCKICPDS
jgi:GH18 family chitinase